MTCSRIASHRIAAQRAVILTVIKACKDTTLGELLELLCFDHGAAFAPNILWDFLDCNDHL